MKRDEADRTAFQDDPESINAWVKDQLEPCPERVDRVIRRALAPESSSLALKGVWRPIPIAACLLIVAAITSVFIFRSSFQYRLNSSKEENAAPEIIATLTDKSGNELKLYVQGNAAAPAAKKRQTAAAIFNQDGLMAAQINDGSVRYIVIGGSE
jgi:hypothetical protein